MKRSRESIIKGINTRRKRGSFIFTEEHKRKISESLRGKKHDPESIRKMRINRKGKCLGNSWNKGRKQPAEVVEKRVKKIRQLIREGKMKMPTNKGKHFSIEHRKKIGLANSIARKGISLSENHKSKIRKGIIKYIENTCGGIRPNIGKYEKEMLDLIERKINKKIIRHFKIDGYYVDGYCPEINTVFEIDENYHYYLDELKEKDKKRQARITELLKCNFIRYRVKYYLESQEINFDKLKI